MRTPLIAVGAALLLSALFFAACSSDDAPEATGPTDDPAATTTAPTDDTGGGGVSFAADVLPIIEAKCASCHTGDGPGTTHLEFTSAELISTSAEFIGFMIEDGQMPPWPATDVGEIAFDFDLGLDPADRETLLAWVAQGGALDIDGSTPIVPTVEAFPPIEVDAVLTPSEPYLASGEARDDYRCRILDPALDETSWLTGLEVAPDQTPVLHHAVIFVAEAGSRPAADEASGSDGRTGWECNTIPSLDGGRLQQITAWAPGTGPFVVPEGSGVEMAPGDYFVVQWHYHFDGEVPPDASGLAVEFATPEEVAAGLNPIDNWVFLGPVEIPCASDESGLLCDRDAALSRIRSEFGIESSFIPEFVNSRCGVSADDFAQFTDGFASSSCDIPLRGTEVVALWPHMHELGTEFRFILNPDTPEERILLDIDRWDFDWQLAYIPTDPLIIEDGDILRMECAWDRSLWPVGLESRYVVWAEGTEDEMCYGTFTVLDE